MLPVVSGIYQEILENTSTPPQIKEDCCKEWVKLSFNNFDTIKLGQKVNNKKKMLIFFSSKYLTLVLFLFVFFSFDVWNISLGCPPPPFIKLKHNLLFVSGSFLLYKVIIPYH